MFVFEILLFCLFSVTAILFRESRSRQLNVLVNFSFSFFFVCSFFLLVISSCYELRRPTLYKRRCCDWQLLFFFDNLFCFFFLSSFSFIIFFMRIRRRTRTPRQYDIMCIWAVMHTVPWRIDGYGRMWLGKRIQIKLLNAIMRVIVEL